MRNVQQTNNTCCDIVPSVRASFFCNVRVFFRANTEPDWQRPLGTSAREGAREERRRPTAPAGEAPVFGVPQDQRVPRS